MNKKHAVPRRRDRMVRDETWIREMLSYSLFCTVASVLDGQPFLRPSAFVFVEGDNAIYIHGAHTGRTIDNVSTDTRVCLCVYDVGAMRVHERAFEFFQEQAGVVVFGEVSTVTDDNRKHEIMQATIEKYAPHLKKNIDYQPASKEEIDETTVLQIHIDHWSGKMKWTEDPHRDRYNYEDVVGNRRPRLPWTHNMTASDPLTLEWAKSRKKSEPT
jgi:nitroimidazol reductase NimA-like FMN-containing flavoprotein (pyridoxamine 5'-phosphate oxidase superfamily)